MAPRPRWWHQLQASKSEALLAIDLYNRTGTERQLEAFIVHMSMAWLRLMQAKVDMDDGDLFIRNNRGHRTRTKDGAWAMRALDALTAELLDESDVRRANLAFFTGLRHQIEHRFERDIASLVAGRTQAYVLNFERTLVEWFTTDESLGTELRFPMFVSTFSPDAVSAVKEVRKRVPKGVIEWVEDFDSTLDPGLVTSPVYDFRVYLLPQTGPKTQADAAMTYVNLDELDADQMAAVDQVQMIIREKRIPVSNLGKHKPGQVVALVAARLGRPFNQHHHTCAWRYYRVRPDGNSERPEVTRSDFCSWDTAFEQYTYTDAWVDYLVRKLSDDNEYRRVCLGEDVDPITREP